MRIDLHCHTSRSWDGWTNPAALIDAARAAGLDRVCVTDHGTIRGALEARERAPELVWVGMEARCAGGTELIGVGIEGPVREGRTPADTAAEIRDLGGVVYAPHPFAYLRQAGWHARRGLDVADIGEVFNPRAVYPPWNRRAARAVRRRGLPGAASSDAHFPWEIGRGYTEVPEVSSVAELPAAVTRGRAVARRTATPFSHALSLGVAFGRRITGTTGTAAL